MLFTKEIYKKTLNTEMITLSACETGLGKIRKGEGIVGLSRAFLYAGAKNITVSLWGVNDKATFQLMSNYYKDFSVKTVPLELTESLNYASSLRNAKLSLINSENFSHPYY